MNLTSLTEEGQSGFGYDLLPKIFGYFDKHLQIFILEQLIADHDECVFNPYTKKSLLLRQKSLLEKTCRLQTYKDCLEDLAFIDEEAVGNLEELMEPMWEKTCETCDEATNLKCELLDLYFEEDEDHLRKPVNEIAKVHDTYEHEGRLFAVVTFERREEPEEVDYEKYRTQIETCLKTEKQRNNLPMLYRFARLLFELHDHPKTGESLLPEVRYSLESYINLVTKNMGELEREYENCAEEEKADHEYLKFKKANLKYHEQAQWGVICCKLLQKEFSQDSVDALKTSWNESKDEKPLAVAAKERAWLLHWVLFQNFLNEKESRQGMTQVWEMFYKDQVYKYTIITVCPWLLRYLVLSAVCSSQKMDECQSLAYGLLGPDVSTYKDPLTEFLRCLFVDCDFDKAAAHLKECRKVFATDIFLCSSCNLFFSQARLLLFQRYSSVNMIMDIDTIGKLLMLGEFGDFPDNEVWSIGGQPVHKEKRALKQWITDTVRSLQKERQTAERDKTEPTYNIRIDLRKNMLFAKPSYGDPIQQLLTRTKESFAHAKHFAQNLR